MHPASDSPYHLYKCEARATGKPSHEFATPDGDTARAMCDAHGWEFIRLYAPGGDSDRPASQPTKGDPALSRAQVRCLAIEAGKAFKLLDALDLADGMGADDWRHAQVQTVTQRDGLSQCQNSHYLKLLRHFKALRGDKSGGPDLSGRQSGEGGDTLERREAVLRLLAMELGSHARRVTTPAGFEEVKLSDHAHTKGGPIGEGYLLALARGKNPGVTLTELGALITLPASRLEQLHTTLRNRIAAREGRGTTKGRNKGQRGKGDS
jgi:hypothetical protein